MCEYWSALFRNYCWLSPCSSIHGWHFLIRGGRCQFSCQKRGYSYFRERCFNTFSIMESRNQKCTHLEGLLWKPAKMERAGEIFSWDLMWISFHCALVRERQVLWDAGGILCPTKKNCAVCFQSDLNPKNLF